MDTQEITAEPPRQQLQNADIAEAIELLQKRFF